MINTLSIFHELEETLESRAAEKIAEVIGRVYDELLHTVTKEEFHELKEIVRDLGDAQKRTEVRMEELADAQKRTEVRMEELAEAQLKTEQTVRQLAQKLDTTTSMVGGLSETVGYGLEDKAYQALPHLLKQDFDIKTEEPLYRRYVPDKTGHLLEVNIFGAATQAGKRVQVIGEAKSQLSKSKIDEFIRKKLKRLEGTYPSLFPVLVTYMTADPDVEEYANRQGIHLYYSYQFVEPS